MRRCVLALVVLSLAATVRADGNELLRQCGDALALVDEKVPPNPNISKMQFGSGYCYGIIVAVHETVQILQLRDNITPRYCPPQQGALQSVQLLRIVDVYLRKHPESLHLPETVLVLNALQDAFPCKQVQSK